MKQIILLCAIIGTLTISAQNTQPKNDSLNKPTLLKDVIITTNRLELTRQQTPQKLEVITKKDIEMTPSLDVGEILKKIAALDVIQRPGVATYATIRGFRPPVEPGKINPEVSVLINGRQSGTQNLALFDPNSIERIEILKGAAGAIYGGNAMGGIINIITKQTNGKIKGNVFGGYGSFETTEMGYSVGGSLTPKIDFDFSGTFFDRNEGFKIGDGNFFRKALGSTSVELFPTTGTVKEDDRAFDGQNRNGTRMGYRSNSLRLGYQINDNWRIDFNGHSFSGRGIESSGDLRLVDKAQGFADRFFTNADIAIKGKIKNHSLSFRGFLTHEENSTFNNYNGSTFNLLAIVPSPTFQASEGIVEWKGFQLQDAIDINKNFKLLIGQDYSEANSKTKSWNQANAAANFAVTPRSPFTPYSYIRTLAPFVQAYITTLNGKLIVNPSMRYDFIEFGILETPLFVNLTPKDEENSFFSPSLALQYNITKNLAVHTNAGRAFRFATAFETAGYIETFFPGNKVRITEGNSNLKNEESVTADFGIKYNDNKAIRFDLTYFDTRVKNRVRQIAVASQIGKTHTNGMIIDQYLTYDNADEAIIQGLELEGAYDFSSLKNALKGFTVFANFNHLIKAEDFTNGKGIIPDAVVRIRNVAPLTVGYGIEYNNHKSFSTRLTGRYVSKRYGQDFGNLTPALRSAFMEFPRYMTLDLTANYTLSKNHVVSLRINNLTDENFYETRGFNMPGRNSSIRYTYNF